MESKTIETLKLLWPDGFYLFIQALLLALFIYSYNETLVLEKRINELNEERVQQQVMFDRRQKEFHEQSNLQQANIERIVKELKAEK